MIATDNKFDGSWVWDKWRWLHDACAKQGLNLVAHASDGDSRLRLTDYVLNLFANRSLNDRRWLEPYDRRGEAVSA